MAYIRSYFKAPYWGGHHWRSAYWGGPWLYYEPPSAARYWKADYWKASYFIPLMNEMDDDLDSGVTGSGGITISGAATTRKESGWVGEVAESITISGSALISRVVIKIPAVSGGVVLSGSAPIQVDGQWVKTGFGSVYCGGDATCVFSGVPTAKGVGGITVAGVGHTMWYRKITDDMTPGVPVFITLEQTDLIWEEATPQTQTDVYIDDDIERVTLQIGVDQAGLFS